MIWEFGLLLNRNESLIHQPEIYVCSDKKAIRGILIGYPEGQSYKIDLLVADPRTFENHYGIGTKLMRSVLYRAVELNLKQLHGIPVGGAIEFYQKLARGETLHLVKVKGHSHRYRYYDINESKILKLASFWWRLFHPRKHILND